MAIRDLLREHLYFIYIYIYIFVPHRKHIYGPPQPVMGQLHFLYKDGVRIALVV
jgi:hypothetical protein